MPLALNKLDGVYYVAGRDYILDGRQVRAGDVVEGAKDLRNIESFVRSRHLIPVVDDLNDVPVYYQKDVKLASLVESKFKLTINRCCEPEPEPEVEETEETPEETPEEAETETVTDASEETEEEPEETSDVFDVSEHTVPEVLEYVGDDRTRAEQVLEAELAGKNRSTLTSALEELLTAPEGETDE